MPLLLLFLRLVTVMKNDTFPDRFGPSFDRRRKPFDLATFVTSTDVLLLLPLLPVVVVVVEIPPPPLLAAVRSSKEEGSADDVLMTISKTNSLLSLNIVLYLPQRQRKRRRLNRLMNRPKNPLNTTTYSSCFLSLSSLLDDSNK
jgi:hypothetical protein